MSQMHFAGAVLTMTNSDLELADAYEPSGYHRAQGELVSRIRARVYLDSVQDDRNES